MNRVLVAFIISAFDIARCEISDFTATEQQLTKQIFGNYDKATRPDYLVNISFDFYEFEIIDINEKNQMMTSSYIIGQYWSDSRLTWMPTLFGNLSNIRTPLVNIWKPDTIIYNSISGDGFLPLNTEYSYVLIHSDGLIEFYTKVLSFETRCRLNVRNYPLDSQTCEINLLSWMNSNYIAYSLYDFVNSSSLLSNSSIWDVNNITLSTIKGDNGFSIDLKFFIKRKPLYYMINSVFPCLILSFITLLGFYIPFSNQIALGKN